jgi:phosphoesterase RecJ-like protein
MALDERQQVLEQLKKAERPLIAFRKQWTPDAAASAVALFSVLKGMGKRPEMVCDGFSPAPNLGFLPHLKQVRPEMTGLRRFIISVDTAKSRIGELSYEAKDGFLHIYLTPKTGSLEAGHVKLGSTDFQHDLIVTVDTPDLASLGTLREQAAEFFFQTPIVNLDHSPANEQYGQVNLVDPTAASVCEIVYLLAKDLGQAVGEELATALLAGTVAKTRSFKTGTLTPRTLTVSSELVSLGAKRDLIVASLYRTKTIPTLKLWGRALARMKSDPTQKVVSTVLTRQDFAMAGSEESVLTDVIDELIVSAPDAETIVLLYERADGQVCCLIRNDIRRNADRLTAPWGGTGGRAQAQCFLKGKTIAEAEQEVMAHLRAELTKA